MRVTTICTAMAVTFALVGARVLAQELIATPDPVGGTQVEAGAGTNAGVKSHSNPARNATAAPAADQWRYRWSDGHWWYWTPQNRWLWYNDGRWVEFDANHSPTMADRGDVNPATHDAYPNYPGYGYWSGAYPGVAVGVRPCGNVNVGVGQRIGVDVAGGHGAVRVGRIYIGW
jgi:hypothetical protein